MDRADMLETMLRDYLTDKINDRVSEGIYTEDFFPEYDPETISIELDPTDIKIPETLLGVASKLACQDYDEHCKTCHTNGCKTMLEIAWRAELKENAGTSVTFYVERV